MNVINKTKNLCTQAKTNTKKKVNALAVSAATAMSAGLASVGLGFCDINANKSMQNFLKTLFNVITFAGVVLIIAGAVSLIRTIISISSGEQAQPGALGKGIGLLVGGIILCAAKALIKAITGQDPTTMRFMQ